MESHAQAFPTSAAKKQSKPIHAAHHPSARTACAIPSHQHHPANTKPWIPQPSTSHPLLDTATHNSHKITSPNQQPKVQTIHIISAKPLTSWHKPPTSNSSNNCQQLTHKSAHQTNKNRLATDQLVTLPQIHFHFPVKVQLLFKAIKVYNESI